MTLAESRVSEEPGFEPDDVVLTVHLARLAQVHALEVAGDLVLLVLVHLTLLQVAGDEGHDAEPVHTHGGDGEHHGTPVVLLRRQRAPGGVVGHVLCGQGGQQQLGVQARGIHVFG